MSKHPTFIGVFDSGIGGLTVLRSIVNRLPNENTVYLGDTARVPYGTKSPQVVTRYALRVADNLSQFPLKAFVVACNTASAVALPALRQHLKVPVIGVVGPGAETAVAQSQAKRIAVLATEGTILSRAYEKAIRALVPTAHILGTPCPLFVPLAEEGLCEGEIVDLVCQHYLTQLVGEIDCAILGCTHYPLLKKAIARLLGSDVIIVDSAEATAVALHQLLQSQSLLNNSQQPAQHRFFFTDAPQRTAALCERFFQNPIANIEVVDL